MKKAALIGFYILFHLFVLRDVRTTMFSHQVHKFSEIGIEQIRDLSVKDVGTRLIYFDYRINNFHKVWHYKIPFGFFFLIGIVGLIFAGADKSFYLILIVVHLLGLISASLIFSFFVYHSVWFLVVCDMLSRYLIPLASFGIIPFSIIDKNKVFHERKAS